MFVSCFYLTNVWNICENLQGESVYFIELAKSYTTSKNTIDQQVNIHGRGSCSVNYY